MQWPGGPSVYAKRRKIHRGSGDLVEAEHVREDRLCADLPVEVEGVSETKLVRLLQWELTKDQFAIAIGRRSVTTAGHHAADLRPPGSAGSADRCQREASKPGSRRDCTREPFLSRGSGGYLRPRARPRPSQSPSGAVIPWPSALGFLCASASQIVLWPVAGSRQAAQPLVNETCQVSFAARTKEFLRHHSECGPRYCLAPQQRCEEVWCRLEKGRADHCDLDAVRTLKSDRSSMAPIATAPSHSTHACASMGTALLLRTRTPMHSSRSQMPDAGAWHPQQAPGPDRSPKEIARRPL